MERLEDLSKCQRGIIKKQLVPGTLLITSSGFESFDQAFNRIQNQNRSRNNRCVDVTNLDDEPYSVLDNNLCDLAGRLIEDDAEVVLCGDDYHVHQLERRTYLGEDTVCWVRSILVVEHLE